MPDTAIDLLSTQNPPADPLADLVGEGKKYKDASALAASRLEADRFIEQLKSENAELRKLAGKKDEDNAATKSIEALIERIEKAQSQNSNQPGTLSREDIEKLVKDGITMDRTDINRKANRATVNAELVNSFQGDATKAATHLKERLATLGMTGEAAAQVAETNPRMFRELFVPQPKAPKQGDERLPQGRTTVIPTGDEERGASYYRKLRKEIGAKYFDPAIQNARMKDALRLGDRFNTL